MACFPLIGISGSMSKDESSHFLLRCYMRAVLAAGGIPLLLSADLEGEALDSCLERLDGVMLAGGNDVDPALYDAWPVQALGEVNPLRDAFEIRLIHAAAEKQMPMLGICRGTQMMNVAFGGTLWQDLPSQYRTKDGQSPLLHSQTSPDRYHSHEVWLEPGSMLFEQIGQKCIRVNSFHHQAVCVPAPQLRVTARSADGVIEGVEHAQLPYCVGVQWHPERCFEHDACAAAVFEGFIQAALAYDKRNA